MRVYRNVVPYGFALGGILGKIGWIARYLISATSGRMAATMFAVSATSASTPFHSTDGSSALARRLSALFTVRIVCTARQTLVLLVAPAGDPYPPTDDKH